MKHIIHRSWYEAIAMAALLCATVPVNYFLSQAQEPSRQLVQSGAAGANPAKRVALVIGNGAYANAPVLKNPPNDARDMAKALRELGFDVTSGINVNQKEMKRLVREFGQKLKSGGSGLFYYAGHGVQSRGRNFLIPTDADIQSEAEVEDSAVDVNLVLSYMDEAQNGLNIVILDACRNNPFARSFRSASGGLAQVDAPTGTLIAYATAPGHVASDGTGQNGLYTSELLKQMRVSGLSVTDMFMRVRAEIMKQTGSKQVPWEASSLVGSFYFSGAGSAASNIPAIDSRSGDAAFELAYWDSIKNSTNPEDFRAYLKKYPNGTFIELARNRLAAPSVDGKWSGQWQNTKGEKGRSTVRIIEESNGVIKGEEDGWAIVNGARAGNVLTWEYRAIDKCRDYRIRFQISDSGDLANGTYEARDNCKQESYQGSYHDYKKASGATDASSSANRISKSPSSLAACFSSDPAAGSVDRNNHYQWAQNQTLAKLKSAVQQKLDLIFHCSAVSDEQTFDLFAAISVLIARYVPDASCFNGDQGVVSADPTGHRDWARERGRNVALDNLKSKAATALGCLNGAKRASFYADVSVVAAGGALK
jgi:Caspase domain